MNRKPSSHSTLVNTPILKYSSKLPASFPNLELASNNELKHVALNAKIIFLDGRIDKFVRDVAICLELVLESGAKWITTTTITINDDVDLLAELEALSYPPLKRLQAQAKVGPEELLAILVLRQALVKSDLTTAQKALEKADTCVTQRTANKWHKERTKKRKGLQKATGRWQATAKPRHEDICRAARRLLQNKHNPRNLASTLAEEFDLSSRQIRNILKEAEIR